MTTCWCVRLPIKTVDRAPLPRPCPSAFRSFCSSIQLLYGYRHATLTSTCPIPTASAPNIASGAMHMTFSMATLTAERIFLSSSPIPYPSMYPRERRRSDDDGKCDCCTAPVPGANDVGTLRRRRASPQLLQSEIRRRGWQSCRLR
jgi:hypothetical protein